MAVAAADCGTLVTVDAHADALPTVQLLWSRGSGADACIDGADLARKVEATLGRPVISTRGGEGGDGGKSDDKGEGERGRSAAEGDGSSGVVVLEGEVKPLGSGWVAVVAVRAAGASPLRREVALDAPDCRQLDEAIVLVVALMADAAVPSPPRLSLPAPPPRVPGVTMALGLDVAVAAGMLPGVAPGFGLSADLALPPLWHVALWAHGWPLSRALDGGVGGSLAAWTFGLSPCIGKTGPDAVSLFGCAGVSGGVIYASGVGLADSESHDRPYLQGEIRVGLRIHAYGPLYARVELGAAIPAARDSYVFRGADGVPHEVFHTAAVIPLGRLGLEIRTP